MNRIFYFTGHRLTIFHWDRKHFTGACSFEPDTDGLDKFRHYLETAEKTSTKLLVDVIEEDFRKEIVPHVFGEDRKAVILRLVDRYYRSSNQFTYAEIIGREKKGRKDDEVLIGGITNPYLIQQWISIIEECGIPLSGVWTLPLVSKKILPVIGAKKGSVLLVSQQVNSNLRQTFFRDGKMLSSRHSVINQDAADISKIGDFARPEVDRTIAYLRNQRMVGPDEVILVHLIGSDEQVESLEDSFESTPLNNIIIHKVAELHEKLGMSGLKEKFSDGLFAWLCMSQWEARGHYGSMKKYDRYYYKLASGALYVLSMVMVLTALLNTESNISRAVEYRKSVELLSTQEKEYKKIYKKKFEEFEPVFTHARSMNAAVDLAEKIYRNSKVSPLDFMIELSNILSQPKLGKIQMKKIEWKIEQVAESRGKEIVSEKDPDLTSDDRMRHVGILKGRIDVSDDNYRGSVDRLNAIISALRKHNRVTKVEAVAMPVEVRSEKIFADESGFDAKAVKKDQTGLFSLRIIMKAPDRV
jgi:hypothetical protein